MYKTHEVPLDYLKNWQLILDKVAPVFNVAAALIMRVWPEQIEVLVSSLGDENPYEEHEKADLGTGLYCETVMASRAQLLVPNALLDINWDKNPDIKLNMVSYLGVPLVWPDSTIFGTLCVLDSKTRHFAKSLQDFLWQLKELIEADFRAINSGIDDKAKIAKSKLLVQEIEALLLELNTNSLNQV